MMGVWEATIKAIRAENSKRIHEVERSLASLKNQTGEYANDHRRVIAVRREMAMVIERHIAMHDAIIGRPA